MVTPLFSVLHPSARPHKWREIYDAWIKAAVHPENVEYVLCVDDRWGFAETVREHSIHETGNEIFGLRTTAAGWVHEDKLVWNTARRCMVDSVNIAAKASTGRILIVIADDQYPCEEWDERLKWAIDNQLSQAELGNIERLHPEPAPGYTVEVSTGTPNEHERGMIVMPILSRARYERLGYIFYPEYESMYADNDFYEHAKQDGCIIDARHLMFPHRHPWNEAVARGANAEERNAALLSDEAYAAQNRLEAYRIGQQVLGWRRELKFQSRPIQNGFNPYDPARASAPQTLSSPGNGARPVPGKQVRGSIALALPGENFSGLWVAKLLEITMHLLQSGWNYATVMNYTSNPGITRQTIWKQIDSMAPGFVPDYILWIDDDQIVEAGLLDLLIADMGALPDADLVSGWTWIASNGAHFNEPQVSCGRMNLDKGELAHAEYRSVQSANGVFEVDWTGFPVVLMRTSALKKAGKHPFAHLPCPESPWGECGEDISFCKRLGDAGGKIYVDSRAFVPHMKQKALGPSPESKDEIALALSGQSATPDIPSIGGFRDFRTNDKGMGILKPLDSLFEPAVDRGPHIENWKIGDREPFVAADSAD